MAALAYIAARPEIWEVILIGGDPLVLSDRRLRDVVKRLAAIEHVKIIRIHTRVPVVAPERITPALVRALKADGKATYVVLHANHARELTRGGARGLRPPRRCRHSDAEPIGAAARRQRRCRRRSATSCAPSSSAASSPTTCIMRIWRRALRISAPAIARGQELMRALRGRHSGLCQPTYVLDIPGGHGKSPIGPNYCIEESGRADRYAIEDFNGRRHVYPPA